MFPTPFGGGFGGGGSGGSGDRVGGAGLPGAMAPDVAVQASPGGFAGPGIQEDAAPSNAPRTYFPETWLWELNVMQSVTIFSSFCYPPRFAVLTHR